MNMKIHTDSRALIQFGKNSFRIYLPCKIALITFSTELIWDFFCFINFPILLPATPIDHVSVPLSPISLAVSPENEALLHVQNLQIWIGRVRVVWEFFWCFFFVLCCVRVIISLASK